MVNDSGIELNIDQLNETSNPSLFTSTLAEGSLVDMINICVGAIGFVIGFIHFFTLRAIIRCKLIPYQVRYLSFNQFMCEALSGYSMCTHQLLIYGVKIQHPAIINTRIISVMLFSTLVIIFLSASAVERVLVLMLPFRFTASVTKRKFRWFLAAVWSTILVAFLVVTVSSIYDSCSFVVQYTASCDWFTATRKFRVLMMAGYLPCLPVLILSYFYISFILRKHERQTGARPSFSSRAHSRGYFKTTNVVHRLVFVNIILFLPFIVHNLVLQLLPDMRYANWRRMLHLLTYISMEVTPFLNIVVLVMRHAEYRHQLMITTIKDCCFGGKCLQEKITRDRIKVYNIATSANKASGSQ